MAEIVFIPIDHLHPHPDNPRKDLGDLTELAESIKAKGILQNLTVVPMVNVDPDATIKMGDDHYFILIGHRRMAAAKLAGLKHLPCVVVDMEMEDQIATMLVENIQRSDLTVYEEAKGFQMMLDLGKTVEQVSDMSGFSTSTVRRRVKLAALDEKKFKKAVDRGATLFDFAKLDDVEDPADRDALLDVIGKPDFKNNLAGVLKAQENRKLIASWVEQISGWAEQMEDLNWEGAYRVGTVAGEPVKVQYVRNYTVYGARKDLTVERPEDADTVRYLFLASSSQVDVYREMDQAFLDEKAAKEAEANERRAAHDAKMKQFEEMTARHRKLRFDFVRDFNQFSKKNEDMWEFIIEAMVYAKKNGGGYYNVTQAMPKLAEILGVEYKEDTHDLAYLPFLEAKRNRPEQTALLTAMWIMDHGSFYTSKWDAESQRYLVVFQNCDALDKVYRLLSSMGYLQSTEETELRNGTHKLFDKVREE